jgi:ParB/Sulfiredoxin domain
VRLAILALGRVRKRKMISKMALTPVPAPSAGRKLAVDYVPIDQLKPDPRNTRVHSKKQIRQIARCIESFGFNVPVLVGANLNVIAGHGRVLAAKHLGLTEVPTIRLDQYQARPRRLLRRDCRP